MGRLHSKVAVVTGAGRGLGRGVARRLAREGASIVIADIDESTGSVARDGIINDLGVHCVFRRTDMGDEADAKALVHEAHEHFGRVDILVNAAQGFTALERLEDKSTAKFDYSMRTGFYGSLWAMQAAVPYMKALKDGRIVNFCSLHGVVGGLLHGDYACTKEAIRGLTRTAAREWGRYGIRVNCVSPMGLSEAQKAHQAADPEFAARLLRTIALNYFGDPEEDVGGAVLFLSSDDSRYVTGMTIFIDGGRHLVPSANIDIAAWEKERPDYNPELLHTQAPAQTA